METRHPTKKAKRVQSWYLYEQYKSLEKNQIDGAKVLRDRSCQEKILYKELEERRARRQFCNQLGSCQSEGRMQSCIGSDAGTLASVSTDDFIDNFCGFQESDETIVNSEQTFDFAYERTNYHDANDSKPVVTYRDTTNTLEKEIDTNSDLTTELKVVKQNIEDSVNKQLEAMKENIQCLEKYAKQSFVEKSEEPLKQCSIYKSAEYDNSFLAVWSGLVSFAYQVMRLNRGNCYYDCSTQLLTAVLLCDILWKGVNKMFLGLFQHVPQHKKQSKTRISLWDSISKLQAPYVSPIKFETEEHDTGNIYYRTTHYTPSYNSKGTQRSSTIKNQQTNLINIGRRHRRNVRNKKDDSYTCNCLKRFETISPRIRMFNSSTTNRWLAESNPPKRSCSQNCNCARVKKVVNPMIKLSRYIDSVLQDLED